MGDFNINLLQHETHSSTGNFLNIMLSHGLQPSISKATRVTDETASLIDNIFTNVDAVNCKSALIYSDISDHYPILFQCCTKLNYTKGNSISSPNLTRKYTKHIVENFKNHLLRSNCSCP